MSRPIPDHDTDRYVARTRARELRWTEPGSPWVEPICVVETSDKGPGSRWGKAREVRS